MQITLNFDDRFTRKLRALHALVGDDLGDFEGFLAAQVEAIVNEKIIENLDAPQLPRPNKNGDIFPKVSHVSSYSRNPPHQEDYGVGSGLSSEEITEEDDEPLDPVIPVVSKEMLANDMNVEDPQKEAVSPDGETLTFEELIGGSPISADNLPDGDLGEVVGNVVPPDVDLEDAGGAPRPNVRKLPRGCKAKVSSFEGVEESSF